MGRKRVCAISGITYFENEMVCINGKWYYPANIDDDMDEPRKTDTVLRNWYNEYLDNNPSLKPEA